MGKIEERRFPSVVALPQNRGAQIGKKSSVDNVPQNDTIVNNKYMQDSENDVQVSMIGDTCTIKL